MSTLPSSVLSLDISKDFLDTDAWPSAWRRRFANDQDAIRRIVAEAMRRKAFVVFEATSVYDRPVMAALDAAGVCYHRANPRKARDFARSSGFLAKTDRLDTAMLAQYGRCVPLRPAEPVAKERQVLRALIAATARGDEEAGSHKASSDCRSFDRRGDEGPYRSP